MAELEIAHHQRPVVGRAVARGIAVHHEVRRGGLPAEHLLDAAVVHVKAQFLAAGEQRCPGDQQDQRQRSQAGAAGGPAAGRCQRDADGQGRAQPDQVHQAKQHQPLGWPHGLVVDGAGKISAEGIEHEHRRMAVQPLHRPGDGQHRQQPGHQPPATRQPPAGQRPGRGRVDGAAHRKQGEEHQARAQVAVAHAQGVQQRQQQRQDQGRQGAGHPGEHRPHRRGGRLPPARGRGGPVADVGAGERRRQTQGEREVVAQHIEQGDEVQPQGQQRPAGRSRSRSAAPGRLATSWRTAANARLSTTAL